MFSNSRKMLLITLLLSSLFLISLFPVHKAYSYPASEDGGEIPSSYSLASSSTEPPAETEPTVSLPSQTKYQVNRGDTLFKIASSFGVSVDDVMSANNIQNPKSLQVGQTLLIPTGTGSISMPGGQHQIIKKVLNTTLTAYTAGYESTGKRSSHPEYGITYSGMKAQEGRTIAVDPNVIPLGSTVFIDGIGIRQAEDIGSAIRGSRIDVFMNDLGDAQEFGIKKNVRVYLLEKENL
ncbi:3D domain-containing protein [Paenibacillus aestuarii]|uniref:3D domain-containing protein n=1 Tax=Paenibacillus aestuarii TaxID=516965 RepID=A0ABW0K190_9BACL|nr:3D domain-containing protein [Paenibacillus aestuarii]